MSEIGRRFAVAAAFAVLALAAVVGFGLVRLDDAVAAFLLVLGGIGLLALVRAVGVSAPPAQGSLFEQALRPRQPERRRPPDLTRIEVDLAFGVESAAQLHSRLVPLLRMIAAARLASRHGVDLGRAPGTACALLGDDAWELVRPDRPAPREMLAPGLPLRRIGRVITTLEEL